jgi:hypothetical protein
LPTFSSPSDALDPENRGDPLPLPRIYTIPTIILPFSLLRNLHSALQLATDRHLIMKDSSMF